MKQTRFFLLLNILFGWIVAHGSNNPPVVEPLDVGGEIPPVVVKQADGEAVDLAKITRGQKAVIIFYRGGWCPYCNAHLAALGMLESELRAAGYVIYALSPDRVEKVSAAAESAEFDYALLSDASGAAARAFGLAFTVDDDDYARLQGFGIDLEEASGMRHRELPVPAVYLVDAAGKVTFRHYDPDYRKRLSNEALLEAISSR